METKEQKKIAIEINPTTLWKAGTFVFGLLFIISLVTGGFSGSGTAGIAVPSGNTQPQPSLGGTNQPQAPEPVVDMKKLVDDDPVFGDPKAPVTIIEFSDFQCPFCGRFYTQTLPQIKKDYIDTGKVKLVYRDLPLPFHEFAQKAAEAGECADEQGKFEEMHDKIFDNQASLSVDNLKIWAQQIGLDANKFNSCLDSGQMAAEVAKDLADANAVGASGTPTFFINGKRLVGAQPFAAFKTVIDQELA